MTRSKPRECHVAGVMKAILTAGVIAPLISGLFAPAAQGSVRPLVVINLTPPIELGPATTATERVPNPFAKSAGLPLLPPSNKIVRYTYHESMFAEALAIRPKGRATFVGHPQFRAPKRTPGPKYFVLPSRGRGTGATTATDVVLRKGTKVKSPVTGTVVRTTDFRLYCQRPDTRIIIRPQRRPNLRVVIFHVDRPRVSRGDTVLAGKSILARVRNFSNSRAQYDDFVPGNHPHIHLEVQRGKVFPLPGCK